MGGEDGVPWKRCYYCSGWSYSAATIYDHWACPYCRRDLTGSPECERVLLPVLDGAGAPKAGAGRRGGHGKAAKLSRVIDLHRPDGRTSSSLVDRP